MDVIVFFLPLILLMVFMYFFIIRPQKKRADELAAVINNLKSGDKIFTISGILAEVDIINEDDDYLTIKSEDSSLRILKSSVGGTIDGN